jgi:uncharacterized membrane protein
MAASSTEVEDPMVESSSVVAIYDTHALAEEAIKALREARFDMKQLSIVGKDYQTEEHAIGFYNVQDRMKFWGKIGAFWGGMWGWLVGAGLFLIPGIGHIIVLGPLVGWLAGALEGAVVGAGAGVLGAALMSAGIPKDKIVKYETAIRAGKFVVLVHGTAAEVDRARASLAARGTGDLATFSPATH